MRARDCRFEGHLAGHAVRGLDEVDLDRRCEVCAAGASTTGAAAEEDVVAEEGREEVGQVAEIDVAGLEAAAPQARVAVAVVEIARLGLREHLVRLDDLTEPLVGIGRLGDVGMELACELSESALYLRLARVPPDSERVPKLDRANGSEAGECGAKRTASDAPAHSPAAEVGAAPRRRRNSLGVGRVARRARPVIKPFFRPLPRLTLKAGHKAGLPTIPITTGPIAACGA